MSLGSLTQKALCERLLTLSCFATFTSSSWQHLCQFVIRNNFANLGANNKGASEKEEIGQAEKMDG